MIYFDGNDNFYFGYGDDDEEGIRDNEFATSGRLPLDVVDLPSLAASLL